MLGPRPTLAAAAASRWHTFAAAAILVALTNGPVFLFAKSVLDRPGHWEDAAVWPFFVAAATASAALAAAQAIKGLSIPKGLPQGTIEWTAVAAVAWFSLLSVGSTAWSVDSSETAWRATVYLGLALLGWVISRLSTDDACATLALMSAAAVIGSVILVVLRPDLALDNSGAWEGVYTNRNSLAPLAGLGILLGVRGAATGGRAGRAAGAGLLAASLAALVGAGSRTASVALPIAAGLAAAPLACRCMSLRRGVRGARLLTAATAVSGAVVATAALAATWDVPTLAQRRAIWRLVWDRIWQRPLAGHGFFTFWDIEELTQHALLRLGSAHNSLMEVGLGLGLLGVVPFIVIVALAARNAAVQVWRSPSLDTWTWAAVTAFMLLENLTESFVLWFSYNWVLIVAAALRPCPPHTISGPSLCSADAESPVDAAVG